MNNYNNKYNINALNIISNQNYKFYENLLINKPLYSTKTVKK